MKRHRCRQGYRAALCNASAGISSWGSSSDGERVVLSGIGRTKSEDAQAKRCRQSLARRQKGAAWDQGKEDTTMKISNQKTANFPQHPTI